MKTKNSDIQSRNKKTTNIRDVKKGKKTYSSINNNFLAKKESEKEKKIYQEKVKLLENRIIALKKHDDEIRKRMLFNDMKQTYLDKTKKEKNDLKQTLLSYDIEKRKQFDLKKKATKNQKNILNKQLKESKEKTKLNKMINYEYLQKEKQLILSKINENNTKIEEYGKMTVNKIKKEREQMKINERKKFKKLGKSVDNYYMETLEDNKQETNKLKNKIKALEKIEARYISKLNQTRQRINKNHSTGVGLFKTKIPPIQKLDLDNYYLEIAPFISKEKNVKKRNHKTTLSVDNKNKTFNYSDKK